VTTRSEALFAGEEFGQTRAVSVSIRAKKKQPGVARSAGRNERSLGFLPLLLMTLIYLVCTVFADDIGPITSAPGFYRLNQRRPQRGCIMPKPSA
jgi:hypothetical protein